MRRLAPLVLIFALAIGAMTVAGCGGSGSGGQRFPKARFVVNAGLAFGAFRHFIYRPYREGKLRKGTPKRGQAIAKALLRRRSPTTG